jgi:hypothetical protein
VEITNSVRAEQMQGLSFIGHIKKDIMSKLMIRILSRKGLVILMFILLWCRIGLAKFFVKAR